MAQASLFLAMLPLELRRLVYKEVLGGKAIHLQVPDPKKGLKGAQCKDPSCSHGNLHSVAETPMELTPSLLQTCKQINHEASEFLYASNRFSITSRSQRFWALDFLSRSIPTHHIQNIRELRLCWGIWPSMCVGNAANNHWLSSWSILQSMSGLHRLRIDFIQWEFALHRDLWLKHQEEMFKPLRNVTVPHIFIVVLPHDDCSAKLDVGSSNCQFILPRDLRFLEDTWMVSASISTLH